MLINVYERISVINLYLTGKEIILDHSSGKKIFFDQSSWETTGDIGVDVYLLLSFGFMPYLDSRRSKAVFEYEWVGEP